MKQSRTRRLSGTLLALAALSGILLTASLDTLSAQTTLRWGRTDPGNAKPIVLHADEVAVWPEPNGHVFLLRGRVWIEQGLVQLRSQQAVVWVDEQAKKRTGLARVEVYAEGEVVLEEGARAVTGQGTAPRALIELATRGNVAARSYTRRISEQPARNDPLYQSALAEKQGPSADAPAKSQARVDPGLQRVSAQEVQPPPGAPAFQPVQGPPQGGNLPPGVSVLPPAGNPAPLPVPPVPPMPTPRPQPPGAGPEGTETPPAPRPVPPLLEPGDPPPQVIIRPRSSVAFQSQNFPLPTGETAVVITSGVIITVVDKRGLLDVEADRAVVWTRGDFQKLFKGEETPAGEGNRQYEFYLSGHVELRQQSRGETTLLRADEVYYDVARGVAVAREADLELTRKGLPEPLHLQGPEILQINPKLFHLPRGSFNASKLPYDPNLKLTLGKASLEEIEVPKRGLFGLGPPRTDPNTGQPLVARQRIFRGRNVVLWLGGVPVFYLPYIQGDADDPLGPLEGLSFNYNRIFGFQAFLTLDMYDLLGLTPTPGTKWRLHTDYMSERGPALGTDYIFTGRDLFGISNHYNGIFKVYGMHDVGKDVLGFDRGTNALTGGFGQPLVNVPLTHPEYRGRGTAEFNMQELPYGFTLQGKLNAISDRNFMEQYFLNEYYNDLDQETWLSLKQQQNNWMWSFLVQPRLRNWMTETEYLPSVDGALVGQKFFDLFTWNLSGGATYAHLRPSHQPPPAYSVTDQDVETGRFDVFNEVSLPLA
ncbi:MAG: hypothetical protein L0Z62_00200, partial [Gemmataceae bacterium]|nr:hypothetical protein [Gemmataceae bacterium]